MSLKYVVEYHYGYNPTKVYLFKVDENGDYMQWDNGKWDGPFKDFQYQSEDTDGWYNKVITEEETFLYLL